MVEAYELARYLSQLASTNPTKFRREWAKHLESWTEAVRERGQAMRKGRAERLETDVFIELRTAEDLLALAGKEAEALIGAQTRATLVDECCRVFALTVQPQLYNTGNTYNNYCLMRKGSHRPPR